VNTTHAGTIAPAHQWCRPGASSLSVMPARRRAQMQERQHRSANGISDSAGTSRGRNRPIRASGRRRTTVRQSPSDQVPAPVSHTISHTASRCTTSDGFADRVRAARCDAERRHGETS
jgi:hypothetical protein